MLKLKIPTTDDLVVYVGTDAERDAVILEHVLGGMKVQFFLASQYLSVDQVDKPDIIFFPTIAVALKQYPKLIQVLEAPEAPGVAAAPEYPKGNYTIYYHEKDVDQSLRVWPSALFFINSNTTSQDVAEVAARVYMNKYKFECMSKYHPYTIKKPDGTTFTVKY